MIDMERDELHDAINDICAGCSDETYVPIKAGMLRKMQALLSGNDADGVRLKFIVENNWIGTATRCLHKIEDGNIESARTAIDQAIAAREG
jgi:hypothetical protein